MTEHTEAVLEIAQQLEYERWLKTPKNIHTNDGRMERWLNDGSIEVFKRNWRGKVVLTEVIPPSTSPDEK